MFHFFTLPYHSIPFLFISLLVPFQCNEKRTEEKGKENGRGMSGRERR